jgi:hypothetical protein
MEPVTVGAIVRSFAGLIMTEKMSTRMKQFLVIGLAVSFFMGYQITTVSTDPAELFQSFINGLEAGLSALGIYHITTVDKDSVQK